MKLISSNEAAEILEVSDRQVRYLCNAGLLPGKKIGKTWIFAEKAVFQLKKRREGKTPHAAHTTCY